VGRGGRELRPHPCRIGPAARADSTARREFSPQPRQGTDAPLRLRQIATLLRDEGGSNLHMIRSTLGKVTPAHAHEGLELGLVLRGRLETDKACYGPRDVFGGTPSCDHGHQVVSDEDGYLLLATAWRLRFMTPLGRLFGLVATGRCETSFSCSFRQSMSCDMLGCALPCCRTV
jgi:hypothetical protein